MGRRLLGVLGLALLPAVTAACGDDADGDGAPSIVSVEPMAGGLHVTWSLPARCDAVEVERQSPGGAFEVVYTLPGAADNKHDGTATEDFVYTYRVRCKVGDGYTPYSNEVGADPVG